MCAKRLILSTAMKESQQVIDTQMLQNKVVCQCLCVVNRKKVTKMLKSSSIHNPHPLLTSATSSSDQI